MKKMISSILALILMLGLMPMSVFADTDETAPATVEEAVKEVAGKLRGSYAIIIMSPRKLVAMRDPLGLKPMCMGKRGNDIVVASESCALTSVGAEFVRDIRPGEIVTISKDGIASDTS